MVSSTGGEYCEHTFWCFIQFGMKSSLAQNAVFWPYFMFIMVRNYLAPNFTKEDFGIQVRGLPANYVYGCHLTPVTCGTVGYVSYQKGIIQGHFVNRYALRRAPALCSRIVFRTVLSPVIVYYKSVKYTLRGYFCCFWCSFYGVHVMSNRWN